MNDDFKTMLTPVPTSDAEAAASGFSTLYRLFEAFIALREKNERQHKVFEQSLTRSRDSLQSSFNTFAADTQRAYQQLRQDILGEKKFTMNLLNELLDQAIELEHILASKPQVPQGEEFELLSRWLESLEVQNRKVQAALTKFGVHAYDAEVGAPYNPALHERVGKKRVEGMDALRIAAQVERGFASQQPEFILRRPKVVVTD